MIYDCFTFFNELDLLEVRLIELWEIVDHFVIVESRQTHQGKPKHLIFKENEERYEKYRSKIIYLECEFPEPLQNEGNRIFNDVWRREAFQRKDLQRGLIEANGDDLILVSDVDEIVSAEILGNTLKNRPRNSLTVFELNQFEYYINRKIKPWHNQGPRMIEKVLLSNPQLLRHSKAAVSRKIPSVFLTRSHARLWNYFNQGIGAPIHVVENAGWHFSSLGGWHKWKTKIDAFAHTEFKNRPEYMSEEAFIKSLPQNSEILVGMTLPKFVSDNLNLFGGLLTLEGKIPE